MPQAVEQTVERIDVEPIATRDAYISAAREFLGVRWQHQGRTEQGIDCVGLLVVPATRLGVLQACDDITDYQRQQDGSQLSALLHQHCSRLPKWQEAQAGDILAIKFSDQPQHVAIITRAYDPRWGCAIIHAFGNSEIGGQVIEHRLDQSWLQSHRARIHAAFSIRGLE